MNGKQIQQTVRRWNVLKHLEFLTHLFKHHYVLTALCDSGILSEEKLIQSLYLRTPELRINEKQNFVRHENEEIVGNLLTNIFHSTDTVSLPYGTVLRN